MWPMKIQVLKHEWPARWRSFIPDLVSAAKTSETICENCMAILKVSPWRFSSLPDKIWLGIYG